MSQPDPTTYASVAPAATDVPAAHLTYIWWEKTVEYAFVREILPSAAEAFPLAGDVEKSFGDLLIALNATCRLIEFKRDKDAIQSEKKKFPAFVLDSAKKKVMNGKFVDLLQQTFPELIKCEGSKAHFFVYGHPEDKKSFLLHAVRYASDPDEGVAVLKKKSCLGQLGSTTADVMRAYLDELDKVRGVWLNADEESDEDGSNGGGGGGVAQRPATAGDSTQSGAKASEEAASNSGHTPPSPSTFVLVSVPRLGNCLVTPAQFRAPVRQLKPKKDQGKKLRM